MEAAIVTVFRIRIRSGLDPDSNGWVDTAKEQKITVVKKKSEVIFCFLVLNVAFVSIFFPFCHQKPVSGVHE